MTKDIVLVTDTSRDGFVKELFKVVSHLEKNDWTVEIQYSTTEKDNSFHGSVHYSALVIAYDSE